MIAVIVNRESHMWSLARRLCYGRLPMAALAAAAAENPAFAHDAAVAAAGFRRTGVQGAKCVHDIVECDRPASL